MVQVRGDGGLEHGGSSGGNKNQMDLEYILKIELQDLLIDCI